MHGRATAETPTGQSRELSAWGGVVSATVEEYAAALGVEVGAIERAVRLEMVNPLTDTATNKNREDHDRPTDPSLRSLAFTREEFEELAQATGGTAPGADN